MLLKHYFREGKKGADLNIDYILIFLQQKIIL